MTNGQTASPQLNARAHDAYRLGIRRMACAMAVNDGEMSENEAWRWLDLDHEDQPAVDWGPDEEHFETAEKRLRKQWEDYR